MIVLAPCGSFGAALELDCCLHGLVPTLFLHPSDRPPGNRVRDRLTAAGATLRQFDHDRDDPELATSAIIRLVRDWLERYHVVIVDAERRRKSLLTRLSRFRRNLQTKRTEMGRSAELKALAVAGLPEDRAHELIEDELELPLASLAEVVALSNAYGVPANIDGIVLEPAGDRAPHLTDLEFEHLNAVVTIDRIPSAEVVAMVRAAQEEVALPGRRRKIYTSNASWRQLRAKLNRKA